MTSALGWPHEPTPPRSELGWPDGDVSRETSPTLVFLAEPEHGPIVADTFATDGLEEVPDARVAEQSVPDVSRETSPALVVLAEPEHGPTVADPSTAGELEGVPDARVAEPSAPDVSRETSSTDGPQVLEADLRSDGSTPLADQLAEISRRRRSLVGQLPAKPPETTVVTISNQKGGVGKTSTTVNLAAALALGGLRILVIDIDPQGNASTALGIPHHVDAAGIYDVLIDDLPLRDVIQSSPEADTLWCVPASIDLAGAEIELVDIPNRETRLRGAIRALRDQLDRDGTPPYDYILIDCPPSLGLLTLNALAAADEVLIPIQCEFYALDGLSQLMRTIGLVQNHLNPELRLGAILLTMYDRRTRLAAQVEEEVRAHFPNEVLRATIPRAVRISEAPSYGQTVITYDQSGPGALSYREAALEFSRRAVRVSPAPVPALTLPPNEKEQTR